MKEARFVVLLTLLLSFLTPWSFAYAEAPVVDLSRASSSEAPLNQGLEIDQGETVAPRATVNHHNEPIDQRVVRLERQVANLVEMNYANKLEKMQQELQQLHGQIEVQNHDLLQLKEQLKNFYQDLDQRVTKIKPDETGARSSKTLTADDSIKPNNDTTTISSSKSKELQSYELAFNLLNKKEYDKAINGFQSFVKEYPASSYTVNAHYWLGEIYYLKGDPAEASKEFQIIISKYPENPKVADAMLKLALISVDAGNYTSAKQQLKKVQHQFPGSTAAKIATLRLKELKQK